MLEIIYSLRSLLYIAIAYIFFLLAQFYYQANALRKKRSLIIYRMIIFYISMGVFFVYIALTPIVRLFDKEAYLQLTNYLGVVLLPSVVTGWLFLKSVFDDDNKNDKID